MPVTSRRALRWPVALAVVVAAVAHVPVTPEHLREAPYMGVAFALFTVAATVLAVVVVRGRYGAFGYRAVVVLCAAAIGAYVATRLVAFPQLADDVGNWGESLGVVSVVTEALAAVLSAVALRRGATLDRRRTPTSPEAWPACARRTPLSSTTSTA